MNFNIKKLNKNYDSFSTYELFKDFKNSVFLDSSKKDESLSKYSFIGINPIVTVEFKGDYIYINNKVLKNIEPFNALENLINEYKIKYDSNISFIAGFIGYFSYDMCNNKKSNIPKYRFILYENIIVFDLKNDETYITAIGKNKDLNESIKDIEIKFKDYKLKHNVKVTEGSLKFHSNFTKEQYKESIRKLKNYIEEGHVYVANMTRSIWCYNDEDSFEIYKKLRSINKAPFAAFLNYEDFSVISSSPERFIKIKDRVVVTSPIKGTRPRGKTKEEDLKNKEELINSEKDKSELLMITDLERNDLSKVCKINTVKVTELFKIEEYPAVFHLVSTVEGILKDNISEVKCISECFPGGSITGAPKARAIEIIEELEKGDRGIYTGIIGYFDLRGNCDFNIIIRTIFKKGNKAIFGVGGGITYESNEEEEWLETIHKGNPLMRVL